MKRLVSVFLVVAFLFISGCSNNGNSNTLSNNQQNEVSAKHPEALSLMYSETATLNPYETSTSKLNTQLMYLLYEPLIKLNNNFEPEYLLAESCVITENRCVVTLKNVLFSDGTSVTADDVVFSYNKAINNSEKYKEQLSDVKSVNVIDSKTVSFILSKQDIYFTNLLDFPIIKRGTDNWFDENNFPLLPTGAGKYVFDNSNSKLVKNEHYTLSEVKVPTINLINAPDDEVINHYISNNSISAFYTNISNSVATTTNGNIIKINTNNLNFIGVNMNKKPLSDVRMRYVISYAIDRAKICTESFYGYATPATGIYNNAFDDTKGLQNLETSQNMQLVVANLEDLGYNNKNVDGYYIDSNGKVLSFNILTDNENKSRLAAANLIASQLNSCGIKATVIEKSWDNYIYSLKNGMFDLYLGEVSIPKNMDVTQIITQNGSAAFGIVEKNSATQNSTSSNTSKTSSNSSSNSSSVTNEQSAQIHFSLSDSISAFYKGKASLHDVLNAFNSQLPIIPICHKLDAVVYNNSLAFSTAVPSFVDYYNGISTVQYK